ncbi:uncharacterized protein LOC136749908 isoform X4 [Amia ocellicauda]|uniref:uncharacterized protein LOC136749908 isoform X4 n=1 Tax=Amia ocellicauda TaxID=2972642 RepID=UPI003463DAB5
MKGTNTHTRHHSEILLANIVVSTLLQPENVVSVTNTMYGKGPMKDKSQSGKRTFIKTDTFRTQNLVKSSCAFVEVALKYIYSAVQEKRLSSDKAKSYIKEILHTILFLGYIDFPSVEYNEVLPKQLISVVTRNYEDVLQNYKSHLPTRPPYSVLLDVLFKGCFRNLRRIMKTVDRWLKALETKMLKLFWTS